MGQLFSAISLIDNISPGEVLVAPATLVEEPYPKPEAPGPSEGDAMNRSRQLRSSKRSRE